MRLTTLVAIALPIASLFTFPTWGQGATPSPRDVIVDIEVSPSYYPRRYHSPATSPNTSPSSNFPSFNSQQLDRQLQRYIAFVEQHGVPDVLIVGSSRALQGVDPLVLQQALEQQGWSGLSVYNFGINGATAQVVDWVLRYLLPANHQPRLIVWADGSRAFNSGRIDQTFNKIVTSKGHQHLMAGIRPEMKLPNRLKLGQVCMDGVLNAQPNGRSAWVDCQRPLKLVVRQASTTLTPTVPIANPEVLGFQVVKTQFNPTQYFQRYPRVAGNFDGDYRNFSLSGRQMTALERVIQFTNTRKIPLAIVNLPLTNTYLDYSRSVYEESFRAQMQRLARARRFTFIDLAPISTLSQNQYFADPSHLNQFGATAVATRLGRILGRLEFSSRLQSHSESWWPTQSLSSLLPLSSLTFQIIPGAV